MYSCAASRKPPVPQAGSQIVVARLGPHHLDDRLDQRPRREVLAGARLDVLGVLLQQPLVGVALHVGVERQSSSRGRSGRRSAAAAWPGPGSGSAPCGRSTPSIPGSRAELGRGRGGSGPRARRRRASSSDGQSSPSGTIDGRVERRLRLLVRHLQEQQVGELLDVVAVRQPVVAQDVAVVPEPLDEAVLRAHARTLRVATRRSRGSRSARMRSSSADAARRRGPAGRARRGRPARGSRARSDAERRCARSIAARSASIAGEVAPRPPPRSAAAPRAAARGSGTVSSSIATFPLGDR